MSRVSHYDGDAVHRAAGLALCTGAVIGASTFLFANMRTVEAGVDALAAQTWVLVGFGAIALGGAAGLFLARRAGYGDSVALHFAALGLPGAALLVAIAAYVGAFGPVLWLVGSALLGCACGVIATRFVHATMLAVALVAVGVGMAAAWLLPGLLDAISRYVHEGAWEFRGPDTPGVARLYVLLGVLWSLPASGLAPELATDPPSPAQAASVPEPVRSEPGGGSEATPVLDVRGIEVSYGPVQVLFGVSLKVAAGEAVALLGTNGAGKSTLLRTIFGLKAPERGRVWFEGEEITARPAEQLVGLGMVQIPGGRGVFPSLTIEENLRMAAFAANGNAPGEDAIGRVLEEFPNLRRRLHEPAGVLSGGEQQMLALARAWILQPRLLAIDELTLGLAPTVVDQLVAFVEGVKADGTALVLVEQSVNTALRVTDRAYFMERGEMRFEGQAAELLERPDLLRSVFLHGADKGVKA